MSGNFCTNWIMVCFTTVDITTTSLSIAAVRSITVDDSHLLAYSEVPRIWGRRRFFRWRQTQLVNMLMRVAETKSRAVELSADWTRNQWSGCNQSTRYSALIVQLTTVCLDGVASLMADGQSTASSRNKNFRICKRNVAFMQDSINLIFVSIPLSLKGLLVFGHFP